MEKNSSVYSYTERSAQMTLFRSVYLWMTLALAITGITAMLVADSPNLVVSIVTNRLLFFGLLIGELALVWYMAARIQSLSFKAATAIFIIYSLLNGVTLSVIFLAYTAESIANTFFVTAGTFGAMCLFGYFTKKDLTSVGSFAIMAVIGLIIATVVNLFLKNEILYWIITYAGVLIFVALTAYDSQKIKRLLFQEGIEVNESTLKIALLGALTLYLDFINLFLYLLRLMGRRQ